MLSLKDTDDDAEYEEIHELAERIREKKKLMKNDQKINNTKKPTIPRTAEPKARERSVKRLKREFEELGVDMETDGGANFEVSLVPQCRGGVSPPRRRIISNSLTK